MERERERGGREKEREREILVLNESAATCLSIPTSPLSIPTSVLIFDYHRCYCCLHPYTGGGGGGGGGGGVTFINQGYLHSKHKGVKQRSIDVTQAQQERP